MVVDIAQQQQLTEVFTTNHCHHRSSSTHRRSSTTINNTSSSVSNNATMTNGHRYLSDELGKKAEQILGHATAFLDCRRQSSIDFHIQHPPRLNITESKSNIPSRSNISNTASSTTVHNSLITTSTPSTNTINSDNSIGKNKNLVTVERLAPLILQLVATPKFMKLPETISRHQSNSKPIKNVMESREMTLALHQESVLKLSDDENEEDDDDTINHTNTVLAEIIDNKLDKNNLNQNNSNDNHLPHSYENQIEPQHSGISSSPCQEEDGDSEAEDSDNQETAHSDAENDDGTNETNPHTFSLMDFVRGKEIIHSEPVNSSLKHSPKSLSNINKRSISPEIKRDNNNHVHNSEEHQNKRKKFLIKRALLKSFISSVNTKINLKRPSLSITIPTHLFLDQTLSDSIKQEVDQHVEQPQRISKRYADGLLKHDTNADVIDNLSSLNNQTNTINGTHLKKNKTSHHVQEKSMYKQEPTTINSTTIEKNEPIIICNTTSTNDIDNKIRPTLVPPPPTTTTTITTPISNSIIPSQPKKEKPTANVKPLQQSTPIDNLSSTNSINNGINISENLTTTSTRSMLPSTKANYTKLKNMSKTDLASLARKKKKQADHGKRTTFEEAREAMGLYLESVCYFIQCANDEPKQDQRTSLLTTTLTMLQQLAQNYKKMFCLSNSTQSRDLYSLQQKFLLINYWLQSFIYHLQFNTNMPTIERCANQVTDYFTQLKNPSSAASLIRTTNMNIQQQQQQSTLLNDNNPISPLSTTSQASSSDISTTSGNNQNEQHRYIYDFSKLMLNSYYSTYYWNKAESLMHEKPLKEFIEQLLKQNQNRRLTRDDTTLDFILYIFDAIELLRLSVA
ncbi:unnamed protein product [Rotaria sordida]|uniref:Uncharacterized protein n=1 Tax=Rotaria sordida TaxID=392033 RepID=A0A813MT77_9BILA|nr:unnamed protein product [Rotaria sordida]CAF0731413.1 unnamed protein product [Rotaria sordida]